MPDKGVRILIMRFHALGDVAITLPACTALRERLPDARIDYLTSGPGESLVGALEIFDNVYSIDVRSRSRRIAEAFRWGYRVRQIRYDIVIDLQSNWVSTVIRILARPLTWSDFDRYATRAAGERVLQAFHNAGFIDLPPSYEMRIRSAIQAIGEKMLRRNGWDGEKRLIVLNPAGLWVTRNWPLKNYVELAKLWREREEVTFILLGTNRLVEKAAYLSQALNGSVINLVNETSAAEAFAILQHAFLVISEDSGLMHMAWVSGIPTLALFGSSRHDWSRPLGDHSRCLNSGDLECGACMEPLCKYGDVHCLTRYTPEYVFRVAQEVISEPSRQVVPR